ncbi:MAG TPA: DUF3016 domain-containing protein [Rudaea sp.]|jgi:hypothetical protein|nr:DUF3016 domain-containing protein [Rudaea sp.]
MNMFSTFIRLRDRCWRALAMALLFAASSSVISSSAIARTELPSRVQVTWASPADLTEVQDNPMRYGILRPADWMQALGDYMRERADRVLPAGQQLHVTIQDITLAGSFEPWHVHHAPGLDDARFVKDIYPPRLKLHYTLLASDGSILREKDVRLTDLGFMQHVGLPTETDPLRYDKRQILDWLNNEFRPR